MPLPLLLVTAPFHLLINLYLLFRFTLSGGAPSYLRALKDAATGLPEMWSSRKHRQQTRKASVTDIARALTWSPFKMMSRDPDIRPRLKR